MLHSPPQVTLELTWSLRYMPVHTCQHSCKGSSIYTQTWACSPFLSCVAGRCAPSPAAPVGFCGLRLDLTCHLTFTWWLLGPSTESVTVTRLPCLGTVAWWARSLSYYVIFFSFWLSCLAEQPQSCCFLTGSFGHLRPWADCHGAWPSGSPSAAG